MVPSRRVQDLHPPNVEGVPYVTHRGSLSAIARHAPQPLLPCKCSGELGVAQMKVCGARSQPETDVAAGGDPDKDPPKLHATLVHRAFPRNSYRAGTPPREPVSATQLRFQNASLCKRSLANRSRRSRSSARNPPSRPRSALLPSGSRSLVLNTCACCHQRTPTALASHTWLRGLG